MEVLDKDNKKIYNNLMKMTKMEKIDCSNVKIPKGWLKNIKDLKINEELK